MISGLLPSRPTSAGRHQLPRITGCWTRSYPWSFWTNTSIRLKRIGKSSLAQDLCYAAVRASYTVRFGHVDDFFKAMAQARVSNSIDHTFCSILTSDMPIRDDLGLHRLTAQQSADLYEFILKRHRASSLVITSNQAVDERLSLFDDPSLSNSSLDCVANTRYQNVIEGCQPLRTAVAHRDLLGTKGGDWQGSHKLALIKIATRPRWYMVLGDHWLNVRGISHLIALATVRPHFRNERGDPCYPAVFHDRVDAGLAHPELLRAGSYPTPPSRYKLTRDTRYNEGQAAMAEMEILHDKAKDMLQLSRLQKMPSITTTIPRGSSERCPTVRVRGAPRRAAEHRPSVKIQHDSIKPSL